MVRNTESPVATGKQTTCRSGAQNHQSMIRMKYGITREQYNDMLADQGGGCAICGEITADRQGRRLHVDHCHETGIVRGLLCAGCNSGLGWFKDDSSRMRAAADYIDHSRGVPVRAVRNEVDYDLDDWRANRLKADFFDGIVQ